MPRETRDEAVAIEAEPSEDVTQWYGRVLAFAQRFGDRALAEDIAQEVYLRVLTYRRDETISPGFLIVTARNVALRLKAARRHHEAMPPCASDAPPGRHGDEPPGSGSAEPPEVLRRLADLPDRQREVVELTAARGLSERQAGLALSMSRSAVCARRRSAIAQLRREQ
ncbi:MAG: RNA polymerase sigma factor [Phycisphaerales bacterium]